MIVRIAKREDTDQTASSALFVLSFFGQPTSLKILEHLRYPTIPHYGFFFLTGKGGECDWNNRACSGNGDCRKIGN